MRSIVFALLIFPLSWAMGQELDLAFEAIPSELLKNANAVVRLNSTEVNIESYKSMKISKTHIITVLNEAGSKHVNAYQYYDKNQKITDLSAKVYDGNGKELDKFKNKDFLDHSASGEGTLYSDSRIKYLRYTPNTYPYTVVFTCNYETSDTAFLPSWQLLDGYGLSVEKSHLKLSTADDAVIRVKENNLEEFGVVVKKTKTQYRYTAENVSALKSEPYAPHLRDFGANVNFALERFSLKGVDGKAKDWKEFGKWIYESLLKGQDVLGNDTKDKVNQLVAGIEDPREKVKKIYEYVQANTRYISVQLGIGGWKPISAEEVDRVKYGDCKGLTNYTRALLKEVGIESYYTIVYGTRRKRDLLPDFPSLQGNHVFLNVPLESGELWLECTSQETPVDYLGHFTDDRFVLKVTPNGGELVRSKKYAAVDSRQQMVAKVSMDSAGKIKANIKINSTGIQYDQNYLLPKRKKEELEEHYKQKWDYVNNMQITSVHFQNDKDKIELSEEINIKGSDYAVEAGDRWLFVPNMFNRNQYVPQRIRSRKRDIVVQRGYLDQDEFTVELPENIIVEDVLPAMAIENEFGEYRLEMKKISDRSFTYKRKLLIRSGKFSKEQYQSFRDFRKQIAKNDEAKIILTKI